MLAFSIVTLTGSFVLWGKAFYPIPQACLVVALLCLGWAVGGRVLFASARSAGQPSPSLRITAGTASALAAAGIIAITVLYGSNIPFHDELEATVRYVVNFPSQSWDERFARLLGVHIDHRLVTTRLPALAEYAILGHLNFYYLNLFSTFLLVTLGIVTAYCARPEYRTAAFCAPFFLLFFQPQYYLPLIWGFGIQYFAVLLSVSLMFLFLQRNTWPGMILASVALIAAAYSLASGVFALLIALFLLIEQKRTSHAVYLLIPSAPLVLRVFDGIGMPIGAPASERAFGHMERGWHMVSYFLEFLGSPVTLGAYTGAIGLRYPGEGMSLATIWLTRIAGCVLLALFAYVSVRRYWKTNPVLYGLLAFVLVNAILAAWGRPLTIDAPTDREYWFTDAVDVRGKFWLAPAYLSRYAEFPCLFAALLYFALLETHPRVVQRNLVLIIATTAVFCAGSFAATVPLARAHQSCLHFTALVTANAFYQGERLPAQPMEFFDSEIINEAETSKIYMLPVANVVSALSTSPTEFKTIDSTFEPAPWEFAAVAENEYSYTFVLRSVGNGPVAKPGAAGVAVFEGSYGSVFTATPLAELHGGSGVIRNIYSKSVTHVVVVAKSDVPKGELQVAPVRINDHRIYHSGPVQSLPTRKRPE